MYKFNENLILQCNKPPHDPDPDPRLFIVLIPLLILLVYLFVKHAS